MLATRRTLRIDADDSGKKIGSQIVLKPVGDSKNIPNERWLSRPSADPFTDEEKLKLFYTAWENSNDVKWWHLGNVDLRFKVVWNAS